MAELTETAIRAAIKAAEKSQKVFDAKGLYLLIAPPALQVGASSSIFRLVKNDS